MRTVDRISNSQPLDPNNLLDHAPEVKRELTILELALWYHDLVYDAKSQNNEEMSAAILRAHADDLRFDATIVDAACRGIMATRHKAVPEHSTDKLIVDIDLQILHAAEEDFDRYERQVRAEYSFVDDASWIMGRTQVLQEFLDRDWIYSTPLFRRSYEGDARANLKRSIARLARGEVLH